VLSVQADTERSDTATAELVTRLRDDVPPEATAGTGMRAIVVGLSLVLLLAAFRSVLVALKAAARNLVSVAAAYGVLVAV
jgi:RND superfamily putative drug exporter